MVLSQRIKQHSLKCQAYKADLSQLGRQNREGLVELKDAGKHLSDVVELVQAIYTINHQLEERFCYQMQRTRNCSTAICLPICRKATPAPIRRGVSEEWTASRLHRPYLQTKDIRLIEHYKKSK